MALINYLNSTNPAELFEVNSLPRRTDFAGSDIADLSAAENRLWGRLWDQGKIDPESFQVSRKNAWEVQIEHQAGVDHLAVVGDYIVRYDGSVTQDIRVDSMPAGWRNDGVWLVVRDRNEDDNEDRSMATIAVYKGALNSNRIGAPTDYTARLLLAAVYVTSSGVGSSSNQLRNYNSDHGNDYYPSHPVSNNPERVKTAKLYTPARLIKPTITPQPVHFLRESSGGSANNGGSLTISSTDIQLGLLQRLRKDAISNRRVTFSEFYNYIWPEVSVMYLVMVYTPVGNSIGQSVWEQTIPYPAHTQSDPLNITFTIPEKFNHGIQGDDIYVQISFNRTSLNITEQYYRAASSGTVYYNYILDIWLGFNGEQPDEYSTCPNLPTS